MLGATGLERADLLPNESRRSPHKRGDRAGACHVVSVKCRWIGDHPQRPHTTRTPSVRWCQADARTAGLVAPSQIVRYMGLSRSELAAEAMQCNPSKRFRVALDLVGGAIPACALTPVDVEGHVVAIASGPRDATRNEAENDEDRLFDRVRDFPFSAAVRQGRSGLVSRLGNLRRATDRADAPARGWAAAPSPSAGCPAIVGGYATHISSSKAVMCRASSR